MENIKILAENIIHIDEVKEEPMDHIEESTLNSIVKQEPDDHAVDHVGNFTEGGELRFLKREVKQEDEEEEVKPPVRVFLSPHEESSDEFEQQHEDPFASCNENVHGVGASAVVTNFNVAASNCAGLSESAIKEELLLQSEEESSESDFSDSDASQENNDLTAENEDFSECDAFFWENMHNYEGQREVFIGEQGPQHEAMHSVNIISIFKLFFDYELVCMIAKETNRYASQYMQSRGMLFPLRSRIRDWKPVTIDEVYVVLAIFMLMGIIQKPTMRSYFSTNATIKTPIFSTVMSLDRFESVCRFLHFVDNDKKNSFQGPKKLFKIYPVLVHLNEKFKKYYLPGQNISIDDSLTLWKGRLSFKQYIPLKAAKFGIKSFELCESSTGYLWSFIVYTGKDTIFDSRPVSCTINKTTDIVLNLIQPLLNKGYTLWMDNYYNSPSLAAMLKKMGTDCVGTLRLNRKNVPKIFREKKLKRGEYIAQHSGPISVLKWMDKKAVSMISTYHKDEFKTVTTKKKEETKRPVCVIDYNKYMGEVDLRDQYLQTYLIERKKSKKWNMKMFRRLLNVTVLNTFIIWKKNHSATRIDSLKFRIDLVEQLISEHSRDKRAACERPLAGHSERLTGRHFPERIPPQGEKMKQQKRCVVCHKNGRRREPTFWCPDCKVGLCPDTCFKNYHTLENY